MAERLPGSRETSAKSAFREDRMAIECTPSRDDKGGLHSTPEKATPAELPGVLGRVGEEGGVTASVERSTNPPEHWSRRQPRHACHLSLNST